MEGCVGGVVFVLEIFGYRLLAGKLQVLEARFFLFRDFMYRVAVLCSSFPHLLLLLCRICIWQAIDYSTS